MVLFSILVSFTLQVQAAYEARLFVNGQQTNTLEAGKPADWKIEVFNTTTNEKVKKFMQANAKHMHMVVISEDYATYAHIHPKLMGIAGDFYLGVNQPDDDADSIGTSVAFSKAGKYHVIAEVFPDVGSLVPVPVFLHFRVEATGEKKDQPLTLDQLDSECYFTTYLDSTGAKARYGQKYRIRFSPMLTEGDSGTLIQMHFLIQEWNKDIQNYLPAANLQPLMGMEGHLFLTSISSTDNTLLSYSHLHGMVHPGQPGMIHMNYFDRGQLLDKGNPTKIWLQFKHGEQVFVSDLTMNLNKHINHMCEGHGVLHSN